MGNKEFVELAKEAVLNTYNKGREKDDCIRSTDELYVVWLCKVLQNNKALLSSQHNDGLYYEVTYNGDKKEMYVDEYKKETNVVIKF